MSVSPSQAPEESEAAVYRKVTWRLMPYLFLCYILAYVDRVNVGFAKLQMQQDLGMSDTAFGVGAGIFFIGYFFFEVPANIMLRKIGARRWLGPIMMVWGVVSACTMLVKGEASFYAVRFVLGIVESGFFPGVILYLTFWYTGKHRSKMVAAFMSAIPVSGLVAGPISGWIMGRMTGAAGLQSWQWLFLMEGVPSLLMGLVTLCFLPDSPLKAKWLSDGERDLVLRRLDEEEQAKRQAGAGSHRLADAFRSPAVWLFCLVYFGLTGGNYGIGFWLPQVMKDTLTKDPVMIGWLYAIPSAVAVAAMLWMGKHSDETGERRWHFAVACIVGCCAFAVSAIPGIPGIAGFAALIVANACILAGFAVFWSLPTALLSGTAAAAGIAWINSVGNLAGFLGPSLVGEIRDRTHSMTLALLALSAFMLMSCLVALYVTRRKTA
ncbi:MAG: MFS transporter [Acidobacteriia bacterium]|nr:MFS transporter [Terriglobia bacterium]